MGSAMDYAACNVVYLDRRAGGDRLIKRGDVLPNDALVDTAQLEEELASVQRDALLLNSNLETLLGTFSEVYVCTTGKACVSKVTELNDGSTVDLIPTLVLIDIPHDDKLEILLTPNAQTPSPTADHHIDPLALQLEDARLYGSTLLQYIITDIQQQSLSRLVVPVVVMGKSAVLSTPGLGDVSNSTLQTPEHPFSQKPRQAASINIPKDQQRAIRYIDIGAVDVLPSPIRRERLPSLAIHVYRVYKEYLQDKRALLQVIRTRKRSWVGLDDQKPYSYLREAMVSNLMDGICSLNSDFAPIASVRINVPLERRNKINRDIGSWTFCAHDFNEDELIYCAILMLQHALAMSELESWRMPTESLTNFLVCCRSAYNSFVPYHNFRHVIDVLQATFYFLVQLGLLPGYPASGEKSSRPKPEASIAALLGPFDALTLLVTAIGHDVGHPGVNNAFLVSLNAPLAQLYNDRSVLESFHCAAYSQILRRHWPAVFSGVQMRQLMIASILATDMGVHFDYMKRLGWLQEKLHENNGTDGWSGRVQEEYRTLACSLLIKCADISNVARSFDIAARWTMILTDEFSRQASMETDLGIPTQLFAPPVREIIELGKSQIGFMNIFALPLFQGVSDVMPAMQFVVDELQKNKLVWEERVSEAQQKNRKDSDDSISKDGMFSPRHLSISGPSDVADHQKSGNGNSTINSNSKAGSSHSKQASSGPKRDKITSPADMLYVSDTLASAAQIMDAENSTHHPPVILGQVPPNYQSTTSGLLDLATPTGHVPTLNGNALSSGLGHNRPYGVRNGRLPSASSPPHPSSTSATESNSTTPRPDPSSRTAEWTSETTDASSSQPCPSSDWASQATATSAATTATTATTKLPLSPSTQGTSITSSESVDERDRLHPRTTTGSSSQPSDLGQRGYCDNAIVSYTHRDDKDYGDDRGRELHPDHHPIEGNGGIFETVKRVARKSSRGRFRLHFWKKKEGKEGVPPVPSIEMERERERDTLSPRDKEAKREVSRSRDREASTLRWNANSPEAEEREMVLRM